MEILIIIERGKKEKIVLEWNSPHLSFMSLLKMSLKVFMFLLSSGCRSDTSSKKCGDAILQTRVRSDVSAEKRHMSTVKLRTEKKKTISSKT